MKGLLLSIVALLVGVSVANAEYVSGHFRKNGTYVQGYQRTEADGNPYNNYSYPGNYNPNTQEVTTGSQDRYLQNYYNQTPSYSQPTYTYPTIDNLNKNTYAWPDSDYK